MPHTWNKRDNTLCFVNLTVAVFQGHGPVPGPPPDIGLLPEGPPDPPGEWHRPPSHPTDHQSHIHHPCAARQNW